MKVKELLEQLKTLDPETELTIMEAPRAFVIQPVPEPEDPDG